MNKKLILLLAVPHILVAAIAIYAAVEANHTHYDCGYGTYEALLIKEANQARMEEIKRLSSRLDGVEIEASSARRAAGDKASVELDPTLSIRLLDIERDAKRMRSELESLRLEIVLNKRK